MNSVVKKIGDGPFLRSVRFTDAGRGLRGGKAAPPLPRPFFCKTDGQGATCGHRHQTRQTAERCRALRGRTWVESWTY